MREKEEKLQFDISDRGFNVKAWYLKDIPESKGDALIEIRKGDILLREFVYPGYKIWNIAAHFGDIVTSELNKDTNGYKAAGSTGLGSCVMPQEINPNELE